MSWLLPLPWNWLTDPWWVVLGNLLFWPAIFAHAWVMDWWEVRRRMAARRAG